MPRLTNLVGANSSEARVPTAYKIDEILLTMFNGSKVYDIQALVTDFTIVESLYTPAVQLSLNVKDNIDFMGQARLSGQEKIKIKVMKKPYTDGNGSGPEQKIDLEFYVTEYPVYGRQNNLIQAYTIRGVTKHAYVSKLKRVSRAVSGKIGDIVKSICIKDLGIEENLLSISERSSASINAVIPNLEPIDAIYWLIKRAFTDTGSPFYFYQSVDGKVYLKSQEELVSTGLVFEDYLESKFFSQDYDVNPMRAYNEAATRILSLNSTINLGKPLSANSGAFASKTYYVDLPSKSINQKDFNYKEEQAKRVEQKLYVTDQFKLETDNDLSKYKDARQIVVPMNSGAYSAGANYNSSTSGGNLAKASSYVELLDSMQHDLTIAGDMELTSGKIVRLKLPAPIDPSSNRIDYTAAGPSNEEDLIVSGKYLVTSVQHNFAEDHIVEFRVKRDSTPTDIFS